MKSEIKERQQIIKEIENMIKDTKVFKKRKIIFFSMNFLLKNQNKYILQFLI